MIWTLVTDRDGQLGSSVGGQEKAHLVHDEEKAAQRLGRRLAVVQRHDGRHRTDTETGDEAADGDLGEAADAGRLDGDANGKDGRPEEDGALATEAVGSQGLGKRANKGTCRGRGSERQPCSFSLSSDKGADVPAERSEVMIDCRLGDRKYSPSGPISPKRRMKSRWMRSPERTPMS